MNCDYELMLSKDQAVTTTADGQNIIETGIRDLGKGAPVYLSVRTSGYTGGSLKVDVKTSATVNAGALVTPDTIATYTVGAVPLAKGGTVLLAAVPTGAKKYIGLSYTASGGGANGKISSCLTLTGESSV